MALQITLDHAQRRLKRDRIAITAGGRELDGDVFSNTWIDPITDTLMLRPPLLDAAWHTSNAGIYAKPNPSAGGYEYSNAAHWLTNDYYNNNSGLFIETQTLNAWARTPAAIGKNRAVWLTFHAPGAGDDYIAIECGWGNTTPPSGASGVSLRFWASGKVEVYRDGTFRQTHNLGGFRSEVVTLLLLPMRRRELGVFRLDRAFEEGTSGFVHLFDEIEEAATDPEITPNAKFWVYNKGARLQCLFGAVSWPASGYATTLDTELRYPPPTGATLETWDNDAPAAGITNARVLGDPAYAGTTSVSAVSVVQTDGSTTFVPNDVLFACRAKLTLTGDGSYTPFVYGIHLAYAAEFADTDATEEANISAYSLEQTLEVPDDPFGVRYTMMFREPATLDAAAAKIRLLDNRPGKVEVEGLTIVDGMIEPVRYFDGLEDMTRRLQIELRDRMKALERYVFRERVPIDGLQLSKPATGPDAAMSLVRFVCERVGFTAAELDLDDIDFPIDEIPAKKCGEFNDLIAPGDSAAQVLRRAHQRYCASFLYGLRPTATGIKFRWSDPELLDPTPVVKLYRSVADAVADLVDPEAALDLLYGDYEELPLEIEANEVRVTGLDLRTGRPVQAYDDIPASKDPTTLPSLRPDNWTGDDRVMAIEDRAIRSLRTATRCVDYMLPLVSQRIVGASWRGKMLWYDGGGGVMVPVWRGDMVELDGARTLRVASLRVSHIKEPQEDIGTDIKYREGNYVGGTPLGMGGQSLRQINDLRRRRSMSRTLRGPDWELLGGQLATHVRRV